MLGFTSGGDSIGGGSTGLDSARQAILGRRRGLVDRMRRTVAWRRRRGRSEGSRRGGGSSRRRPKWLDATRAIAGFRSGEGFRVLAAAVASYCGVARPK